MPLRITPRGEPMRVEHIITLILGNPGAGKTTLANTASNPLLLDFDSGSHRSLCRPDTLSIHSWSDLDELEADNLADYDSVIIDTGGRCLETLADDIIRREPKLGKQGQLTLQGYGRLKGRFSAWLASLRGMRKNIVITAHAIEERHGDDVKLRVDAMGASREEMYKCADLMGRITIQDGKPTISWDPSDSGFGKNPGGLPTEKIPDALENPNYLAQCINHTLSEFTRRGEDNIKEEDRLRDLHAYIDSLDGPDDFSRVAQKMRDSNALETDRKILLGVAKARGYILDRKTATFSDPNAEIEGEEETEDHDE